MGLLDMTVPGLQALANRLADDCRKAAARGDHAADNAAFERLLPVLAELNRREEAADDARPPRLTTSATLPPDSVRLSM
jgi:hypothetical protein